MAVGRLRNWKSNNLARRLILFLEPYHPGAFFVTQYLTLRFHGSCSPPHQDHLCTDGLGRRSPAWWSIVPRLPQQTLGRDRRAVHILADDCESPRLTSGKRRTKLSLRLRCRMEFGLLDNLVGQAETSRAFSDEPADTTVRGVTMSGWRCIGLLAYYILLSALTVLFAAAFATAPYWIWPA